MIQHFLDYIAIERKYSPRTVEAYRDDLRDFGRFMGWSAKGADPLVVSAEQVRKVGEDDVKTWMLEMLEQDKQSPRSVKRKCRATSLPASSRPKPINRFRSSSVLQRWRKRNG